MNIRERIESQDWKRIESELNAWGYAVTKQILEPEECQDAIATYDNASKFRSTINMAQFRFGVGEYKYFADPLPTNVQSLRAGLYPQLAPIANRWMELLETKDRYPSNLSAFLEQCAQHRQVKPTPLLLKYGEGGYNCLHQDLYGDVAFPLQATIALSKRADYTGGEFLLVEQRPRAQSSGSAIQLEQGEAVIFATGYRPASGSRGAYKVNLRHGVSRIRSGQRYTLGIIFHNAK